MEGRMAATSTHTTNRLSTYVLTSTLQIVSSSHLSLTVRLNHYFWITVFSNLWGSFSRLLRHPQRLTNWLNLSVSERSYGIEFWPFPDQHSSLGNAITMLGRSFYRDTASLGDQSSKPCKRVLAGRKP